MKTQARSIDIAFKFAQPGRKLPPLRIEDLDPIPAEAVAEAGEISTVALFGIGAAVAVLLLGAFYRLIPYIFG